ncbi:MAG: hypothetical protein OS130_05465 [Thermodesulfobacteriota bacterium]|nr:MAG: hypothetical protein OS130_05465 [Thermodesulfobacteriota bacterium]
MKKIFLMLLITFFGFYSPSLSFGGAAATTNLLGSAMTQGEVVDLVIKVAGLEFFLPKNTEDWDKAERFAFEKNLVTKRSYTVFEKAKMDEPANCSFLAEVVYEITTPLSQRANISCQEVLRKLKEKKFKINCACEESIDKDSVLTLLNDPQVLSYVLRAANPLESPPLSTALSEAYSTPASPIK